MWGILNVNTSSHVPQDETYVGPRAFSEPEVRAVRNLVAVELFSGVLTYHSRLCWATSHLPTGRAELVSPPPFPDCP
jgi:hypothetical protein